MPPWLAFLAGGLGLAGAVVTTILWSRALAKLEAANRAENEMTAERDRWRTNCLKLEREYGILLLSAENCRSVRVRLESAMAQLGERCEELGTKLARTADPRHLGTLLNDELRKIRALRDAAEPEPRTPDKNRRP